MKIYDVTVTLSSQTPLYPGDPAVVIERKQQLDQGDLSNTSYYSFGSHTGTHVDAPSHFVKEGITVDQIPPEWLIGRTRVIEFASGMAITAEHLQEHDLADVMRVLFKTRNSYLWDSGEFVQKYVHLTADAAQYLVESGIKVVGIDYLSVDQYPCEEFTVHQTLLCNGVIIIEGLNLREVEPGDYDMFCLPLKIKDGDGAPARVLLRA
ncbi:MAG: cyclase family protein [Acidobacteriota bacterium]|nr:cyclase family protein [Blastocatellia bacterium]MDW8239087.1 cyclase family protein [Acidobacteriota bacterium]